MASIASTSWTTFYSRNREDEGTYQSLFDEEFVDLVTKTVSFLEQPDTFTQSIAGSMHGNMIIVPAEPGKMNIIHHGFLCNKPGGSDLVFIQGNLGDSCYFKVLAREDATAQIKVTNGRRTTTVNCPTLESMTGATTGDEFASLVSQGNVILRQKPNLFLIHPAIFHLAKGAPTVRSRELAIKIIDALRVDPEEDDEEEVERKLSDATNLELLLGMLWASDNGGLTAVRLTDVDENPTLNHTIRNIKRKLIGDGRTDTPERERRGGDEPVDDAAAPWAISSQSIVRELNRMHESRENEISKKESNLSLLKALGPDQKRLFTALCTTKMGDEPVMSEFMLTLIMTKTPQKAIGLLKAAGRGWSGTFSEGCCHRFLSTGFLSLETNLANPGGFTVFMFHPKTVDMGARGFDSTTASLREYFDMDVEDDTIAYYAKQGFFHPTNAHDLKTQLQTAFEMLELLTCKGSIATKGLAYILETRRWNRAFAKIHDRFQTEDRFGSKFVYSVDTALQNFFDMITSAGELPDMVDENLLVEKAKKLMDKIEDGDTLTIALPAALSPTPKKAARPTSTTGTEEPSTKRSKATTPTQVPSGTKTSPVGCTSQQGPAPVMACQGGCRFPELVRGQSPRDSSMAKVHGPPVTEEK
ncbi:hypothetical protein MHU86_10065 [Fragilaria crotonensis]|nr:hypothetical protein MHU86_10065 [Fragilaria crotonensis]